MQDAKAEVDTLGTDGDAPLAEIAASMGITLEQLLGLPPADASAGPASDSPAADAGPAAAAGSSRMAMAPAAAPRDDVEPPAKRARRNSAGQASLGAAGSPDDRGAGASPAGGVRAAEGGKRRRARRSASMESSLGVLAAVKEEEGDLGEGLRGCLKREVKDLLERQEEEAALKREMQQRSVKGEGDKKPANGLVRICAAPCMPPSLVRSCTCEPQPIGGCLVGAGVCWCRQVLFLLGAQVELHVCGPGAVGLPCPPSGSVSKCHLRLPAAPCVQLEHSVSRVWSVHGLEPHVGRSTSNHGRWADRK